MSDTPENSTDTAYDYLRYKEKWPDLTMDQFVWARDRANDPNGPKFRDAFFVRIPTRWQRFVRWLQWS